MSYPNLINGLMRSAVLSADWSKSFLTVQREILAKYNDVLGFVEELELVNATSCEDTRWEWYAAVQTFEGTRDMIFDVLNS